VLCQEEIEMPSKVRSRAADAPGARERIVLTAERMFAERGYDATSTAKLAVEAGVPQGLVFYYFATKLDLLLAIVRERPTPQAIATEEWLEPGESVRELLDRVIAVLDAELYRHRHIRVIVFREAHLHPEIDERARQLVRDGTSAVAGVLARGYDATHDQAVLNAVAGLVVRSRLIDAVLLRSDAGDRPGISPTTLDLLATSATTTQPGPEATHSASRQPREARRAPPVPSPQ
jgi:AcrR family transcriptional regulator